MMKEPLKLEVVWEELELPEATERLAAAFELLFADDPPEGPVQKLDLDCKSVTGNDQIAKFSEELININRLQENHLDA